MSRSVHHVILLLLCYIWSTAIGYQEGMLLSENGDEKSSEDTWNTSCCACCEHLENDPCMSKQDCNVDCKQLVNQNYCKWCHSVIRCGFAVEFMVAAQIALGAALLLAVSALSFLIWKMCFRNSLAVVQGRNRVRAFCGLPEVPRRSSASSSLNSVQNFVIQKMRDRPPRYDETPPQMPPCYDEVVPSCTAHSSSSPPITVYSHSSPAMLPLYEQIYPQTSWGEASNVAAAVDEERSRHSPIQDRTDPDSSHVNSAQSHENPRREEMNQILYDEACGGMVNPAFIPEIQEQHI